MRSLRKGYWVHPKLKKKVEQAKQSGLKKIAPTYSRGSMIIPDMVGLLIPVHNGRLFRDVHVDLDMIGHKLGEFVETKTFKGHPKK